jgi:3'(2'), 5'-bisphosphate nucleotidase
MKAFLGSGMTSLNFIEIDAIHDLLLNCGEYALRQSKHSFQVFEKGVDDFVTTVDKTLDQRLLQGFRKLFPEDGIITEENVATLQQFDLTHRRLWFIDPIDGTDDFIQGKADYSVMIGQLVDGSPTAGWVYAPAYRNLCWGGDQWGLFQQSAQGEPRALEVIEPPFLLDQEWSMVIGDKDRRRFGPVLKQRLPGVNFMSLGSFGLKVLSVIRGKAGLYGYFNGRVKLWDTTGPLALAKAAGLTCCDLEGNPIKFIPPHVKQDTLVHRQPILVGWPNYIERLRPLIRDAIVSSQYTMTEVD